MKQFPSNKNMIISIIVLLVYFNISFVRNLEKKFNFYQYDWNKQKKIDSTNAIKILTLTKTKLQIVLDKPFYFYPKYTYILKSNDKNYYFRFEYLTNTNGKIAFYDVHWLRGLPLNFNQNFSLIQMELPLIQKGVKTITIGDDNFCRGYDEFFRIELAQKAHVKFIGEQRDVIGFPMSAVLDRSSADILKFINNMPQVDNVILLFNWQQKKESLTIFLQNLPKIKQRLATQNYHKVFWIVPPENTDESKKIIKTITAFKSDKIIIINPYESVNDYILTNSNGLYKKEILVDMAKQIAKKL